MLTNTFFWLPEKVEGQPKIRDIVIPALPDKRIPRSQPGYHEHRRIYAATMPPQIKQDLNRSGWESTDFPSVCENCLPENPYVKMLKEDYGAECKMVSAPETQPVSHAAY